MSFFNSILKFFIGDKTKKDIKSILPVVEEVKVETTTESGEPFSLNEFNCGFN